MRLRVAGGCLVGVMMLATAAPVPKALKTKPALNGTWEVVGFINDGGDGSAPAGPGPLLWSIDGEALTKRSPDRDGGREITFALRRRSDVGPRAVDYLIRETGVTHEVRECVFDLEGETLRLCWLNGAGGRPADCTSGEGRMVVVLKRWDGPEK